MTINKVIRSALKALSYTTDINLKKNYKLQRKVVNVAHYHYMKPFYKTWDHEVFVDNHKIPVRIFSPDAEFKFSYPVLLFFHGGGWVTGNIDSYDKVCTNMAKITNHIIVSVDYRLAPEHHFPAAVNDCYTVARELILNTKLFNVNEEQITLIGDSAGGNLAAAVSLKARDKKEFSIKKQILIYPSTYNNHSDSSPFKSIHENGTDYLLTSKRICDYMDLYKGSQDDINNPYFAPLMTDNFENQPKTLIITAEYDPLRDEAEAYGFRLKEAGNVVYVKRIEDALHGFFSLPPIFGQVKECYTMINSFLREV